MGTVPVVMTACEHQTQRSGRRERGTAAKLKRCLTTFGDEMRIAIALLLSVGLLAVAGCCATGPVQPESNASSATGATVESETGQVEPVQTKVERYFHHEDYEDVRSILRRGLSPNGRAMYDETTGYMAIWDDDATISAILKTLGPRVRHEPYPAEETASPMMVEEFPYSAEAERLITQILSEDGRAIHNPDSKKLVVYDLAERIEIARQVIEALEAD